MDPHPLPNLCKRSNYDEPIASEFCALDYLYEALLKICESENYDEPIASELSALDYLYGVLLEIRESKNYDEEIYEEIHDNSLNKKHNCNDFTINSLDVNRANNMQNPKLGDANFAMSTTCCNDHDWVILLTILKIYLSPMMNMRLIIVFAILLKVGLEEC